MHRAHPRSVGGRPCSRCRKCAADRVVVGLDLDAPAVMREVVPVEQHRAERRHQPIGDVARAGAVVVGASGQHAAERRDAGAHHVHRMRRRRQRFQHPLHRRRQPAQRLELGLVGGKFGRVGKVSWTSRCAISSNSLARRRRGCRSRDNAGRCRYDRPCRAPCCRQRPRTKRPTSWVR